MMVFLYWTLKTLIVGIVLLVSNNIHSWTTHTTPKQEVISRPSERMASRGLEQLHMYTHSLNKKSKQDDVVLVLKPKCCADR